MNRVITASAMPMIPHRSQAGKNDPRMLNDGAREQPASNDTAATQRLADAARRQNELADVFIFISGRLPIEQVPGLISQRGQPGKQVRARAYILAARIRQSLLR